MATPRIRTLDLGARDGSLYVHGFHSSLAIRASRVVASSEDQHWEVPTERLGRVFVFGNCTFTGGVIEALLDKGVTVFHLGAGGSLRGITTAPPAARPELRRAQWTIAADPENVTSFARCFVTHKITNQRALLLRYRRRWKSLGVLPEISQMRDLRRSLPQRGSIDEIRGVEGAAARAYFSVLRQLVPSDWGFTHRRQRPVQDPVNSLLSFGYSLLQGEVRSAVVSNGLDETAGYLHGVCSGRSSLALDLMEEFRPLIVDTVVLSCINNLRISKGHFLWSTTSSDSDVRLTQEGRRIFFREYERRMTTTSIHRPSSRVVSYRESLFLQARHLSESILNPEVPFQSSGWS